MPDVSVDYKKAFENAGLDFSKVFAKGVAVKTTTAGIKFHLDGEVLSSLPIAPGKLSELAVGFNPKNQSHLTMKASLGQTLKMLEEKFLGGAPAGINKPAQSPFGQPAQPAQPAPMDVIVQHGDVSVFPLEQMKTAIAIKLSTADKLFQPVTSTSAGSRYFVVGLGEGIAVAARIKGSKLSVRIEGTAFAKMQSKIIDAGVFGPKFAGSFESNYASMHVVVDGKKEAQRVVGAILSSLAPYIKHPTPDLAPLVAAA